MNTNKDICILVDEDYNAVVVAVCDEEQIKWKGKKCAVVIIMK